MLETTMRETISPGYLAVCQQMHADDSSWGVNGGNEALRVKALADKLGCKTILDYGCGKGRLAYRAAKIGYQIASYDPAFPPFAAEPEPADLVVCRDVMEHVEAKYLDSVLAHIRELANKAAYFVISMRLATARLPDGRNAHLIVAPKEFWLEKLGKYFEIDAHSIRKDDLRVVVY